MSRVSQVKGGGQKGFYLWGHGIEMEDQGMSEDNELEKDRPICLQWRMRLHMHLFLLLGTNDFPPLFC